ncbi:MAG: EF-hand domain-containing protein [Gammaproteobacteria bacterium]|nr:EF-hand domain-containing protein [Gammaproteobacteria bacterium]
MARAVVGLTAAGLVLGSAALHVDAQADEGMSTKTSMETTPGGKKTTGDRGAHQVYQDVEKERMESAGAVQRAPDPRTTGDRGAEQDPYGQDTYMGREARREAADAMDPRGTSGDRGINTRMQADDMQSLLDDYQGMIDEQQARLDNRQTQLEVISGGVAYRTSGDRGVNQPYRPEPAQTPPRFSGDAYTTTAPRTTGDRGVNQVYRDEQLYRERFAHEREGMRSGYPRSTAQPPEMLPEYVFLGAPAPGYQQTPPNRGPRTAGDRGVNMPLRGNGDVGQYEPYRYYPPGRTTGDRGVSQVWREGEYAREQGRIDREQRLLDSQQRRLDRLQRKLDRQVERIERTTTGDRASGAVTTTEQAPGIERTLDQLFSQLDRNADDTLKADEAKRVTIIWRNFDALDVNNDGALSYSEFAGIIDESEAL